MLSSVTIMVASIILCCIFSLTALIFLIMWLVSIAHGGLQKTCPNCSALVPSSAIYCTHCAKAIPQNSVPRGGHKSFLVIFGVCLAAVGLSIAGIVYGAVSSGFGDSQYSTMSLNLKSTRTSSGWDISFDSVKSGWLKKNIHINNGTPKTLHVQSHLKSGTMLLEALQNGEKSSLDLSGTSENSTINLSKFKGGKVTLKVTIDRASSGGVTIWWD
jgi:hypothetical protein